METRSAVLYPNEFACVITAALRFLQNQLLRLLGELRLAREDPEVAVAAAADEGILVVLVDEENAVVGGQVPPDGLPPDGLSHPPQGGHAQRRSLLSRPVWLYRRRTPVRLAHPPVRGRQCPRSFCLYLPRCSPLGAMSRLQERKCPARRFRHDHPYEGRLAHHSST